jgi:hypothetical protein
LMSVCRCGRREAVLRGARLRLAFTPHSIQQK